MLKQSNSPYYMSKKEQEIINNNDFNDYAGGKDFTKHSQV